MNEKNFVSLLAGTLFTWIIIVAGLGSFTGWKEAMQFALYPSGLLYGIGFLYFVLDTESNSNHIVCRVRKVDVSKNPEADS